MKTEKLPPLKSLPHNADVLKIYISVENTVRKGQISCDKQFFIFSQCFLPYMALIFHFKSTLKCRLQLCFNLDQSRILSSGNGLK